MSDVRSWIVAGLCALLVMMGAAPVRAQVQRVVVTPDGGNGGTVTANTGGHTLAFTVTYENESQPDDFDLFNLECTAPTGMTCNPSSSSVGLLPGEAAQVTVTFTAGSSTGQKTIQLRATGMFTGFTDAR